MARVQPSAAREPRCSWFGSRREGSGGLSAFRMAFRTIPYDVYRYYRSGSADFDACVRAVTGVRGEFTPLKAHVPTLQPSS
eukprot:400726-Prymnesium_polylepis.1